MRRAGFTLIELLAAILIMAMMTIVVGVTFITVTAAIYALFIAGLFNSVVMFIP